MTMISEAGREKRRWLSLIAWAGLTLSVGYLGSIATTPNIEPWYHALIKPVLTPPDWVFAPVWTLLYLAMAVAAWRITTLTARSRHKNAIILFFVQLALNLAWSFAFFAEHSPATGLFVIVALAIAIGLTIRAFFRLDWVSAWLMVPVFAWVLFATYLNIGIVALNG